MNIHEFTNVQVEGLSGPTAVTCRLAPKKGSLRGVPGRAVLRNGALLWIPLQTQLKKLIARLGTTHRRAKSFQRFARSAKRACRTVEEDIPSQGIPHPTLPPTTSSPQPSPTPGSSPAPTPTPTTSATPILTDTAYSELQFSLSRNSGTAPAAVYFDVVGELSWQEIEEARFEWDFGDGSPPFIGYMAAHVYQNPGVYNATLRVYYKQEFVREVSQSIEVTPFSGTTCYVSSSTGSDSNSGLTSALPLRSFGRAMELCLRSNHRVLFRRGDTFQIQGGANGSGISNFLLGAYGTGASPHFVWMNTGRWIPILSGSFTGSVFQDFSIEGNFVPGVSSGAMVFIFSGENNLVQRVSAQNLWGFTHGSGFNDGLIFNEVTLQTLDAYGFYGSGPERVAFLNSHIEYSHYEHCIRIQGGRKALVSNTHLILGQIGKTTLTLRGDFEYGLVTGSQFQHTLSVGPENDDSYQLQDYVIIEKNRIYGGSIGISAEDVIIRNNILDGGGHISLRTHPLVGIPNRISIYNNTFYSTGTYHTSLLLGSAENVKLVNNIMFGLTSIFESTAYGVSNTFPPALSEIDYNLIYQPNRLTASSFFIYYPAQITSFESWQNTYGKELQGLREDPLFLNPAGFDFSLAPTSPAKRSGLTQEALPGAFEDYFGSPRPLTAVSRGAVEPP